MVPTFHEKPWYRISAGFLLRLQLSVLLAVIDPVDPRLGMPYKPFLDKMHGFGVIGLADHCDCAFPDNLLSSLISKLTLAISQSNYDDYSKI